MLNLEIIGKSSSPGVRTFATKPKSMIMLRNNPKDCGRKVSKVPSYDPEEFPAFRAIRIRSIARSEMPVENHWQTRHVTPCENRDTYVKFPKIQIRRPKVLSAREFLDKKHYRVAKKRLGNLKKQDSSDSSISESLDFPELPSAVKVFRPLFKNRPFSVFFQYPPCNYLIPKPEQKTVFLSEDEFDKNPLSFYITESMQYPCLYTVLENAGFYESDDKDSTLYISNKASVSLVRELSPLQKVNHFPGSSHLGRKDMLWRHIHRMQRRFPEDFNFCPMSFIIPEDSKKFQEERSANPSGVWIAKPPNGACGKGIRLINKKKEPKQNSVVSRYISNPHLINGFKYDLRLYVCVTSFDPLKVYLYQEGLVRFATLPYTNALKSLNQKCMHLTNFSINKHSSGFKNNSSILEDGSGSKWTISAYKEHLLKNKSDPDFLFAQIHDIIIKALVSVENHVFTKVRHANARNDACFELFGFDILVDTQMQPHLLEINIMPSLSMSSPIDTKVKLMLVSDTLTLAGIKTSLEDRKIRNVAGNEIGRNEASDIVGLIEENERKGRYQRIFPLVSNVDRYRAFFTASRAGNESLWKSLKSNKNLVKQFYKRIKYKTVS